jgi:hypothetical protein
LEHKPGIDSRHHVVADHAPSSRHPEFDPSPGRDLEDIDCPFNQKREHGDLPSEGYARDREQEADKFVPDESPAILLAKQSIADGMKPYGHNRQPKYRQ